MQPLNTRNNFFYLTISLVSLLFASALVEQFPIPLARHLVQALTILTVAAGIMEMHTTRFHISTRIGLLAAAVVIMVMSILLDVAGMHIVHVGLLIAFYCWAIVLAAKQILFTGTIDTNKMVGAICIYLLMGVVWALGYALLAQMVPAAFNGMDQLPWYENFSNAAYYSYVTLTTLGYGDISPVLPLARFLVYMEAVVGVFYMAILVASLVGIRSSHSHLS